ncbi:hypothetical protein N658DRAFT_525837 [Parathielavia hyrcaniae]|uniref:F-box domain-containing protein n=1 Tax=Parathielavia hyrcaniae TaxID=113614 RepID=A0AAN6PXN8_9PEZI|nr:hypothetical protein N658DRAFT_525837 [Parathielavia hyrcaniae]
MEPDMSGSQKRAHIIKLPVELLTMIGRELKDEPRSLAWFGQACRAFHPVAMPLVYQNIDTRRHSWKRSCRHLLSLVAFPACAQHVESISFADSCVARDISDCDPAMQKAIGQAIKQLFGIQLKKFDLEENGDTLIVMAAAALAPKLSKLELAPVGPWSNTNFMLSNSPKSNGPRRKCIFKNLTKISVGRSIQNVDNLDGLLHSAPNLQTLSIHKARGGSSLTARLPSLTSLCLSDSNMNPGDLRQMLQACNNLVCFEYSDVTYPNQPPSPAQVIDLLAPCQNTLQKLHLSSCFADRPDRLEPRQLPAPWLTKLDRFPALRQVAVDYKALERGGKEEDDGGALAKLVWDCPALEGLFVMGVDSFETEEFACFTRSVVEQHRWPRLEMLKLQTTPSASGERKKHDRVLKELWAELELCEPDSDAGKLRAAGVDLRAVSGHRCTYPFAE